MNRQKKAASMKLNIKNTIQIVRCVMDFIFCSCTLECSSYLRMIDWLFAVITA